MIPWGELNPEQRQAVEAWKEALLVLAPVGTGKTNVLALRAAHAIEQGVPPGQVLCLSFTNRAARELKQRLVKFLGKTAAEATACTFHSLCARILRAEAPAVGWDRDFVIYDEEDCRTLCGGVASSLGIQSWAEKKNEFEFFLFQTACEAKLSRFEHPPGEAPQTVFRRRAREAGFDLLDRQGLDFKKFLAEYVHALRDRHAVDFADLIGGVNRLWQDRPEILAWWQQRYAWIQVDEVQDTNHSEYVPLRLLAERHARLSMFGDVDQTIYEWRGSAPREILADFKKRFAPVREILLLRNYRSTRHILDACRNLIRACPGAVTRDIVPVIAEQGEPVGFHEAVSLPAEAEWIASRARRLTAAGVPYGAMAVLTRTNFTAREFSRQFARLGLPHLRVDEFKFFQRAEVKDALAHLRVLVNPHDEAALTRFLQTPPKGIGEATMQALRGAPREAGLKIGDLLDAAVHEAGDPFLPLLDAVRAGRAVVFDLETTGLSPGEDEIIELAAARCSLDGVEERFHAWMRPSRPVGESERIHHTSDAFLAGHGENARAALERFRRFSAGCVLVGHNIARFDLPMLAGMYPRLGLAGWAARPAFDTLDITCRFHRLPRYTLEAIAKELSLAHTPTHQAGDDVAATADLLLTLLARVDAGLDARRAAVQKFGARFRPLAGTVSSWRENLESERPPELLERVLGESRLLEHYAGDPERYGHLHELLHHFELLDEVHLRPADALRQALASAALAREIDGCRLSEDQVALITVHQAKGLEFDTVFIANAADGEFPSRRSVREGREREEHRLFYVALSRARRRLQISYSLVNSRGKPQARSRYIPLLGL